MEKIDIEWVKVAIAVIGVFVTLVMAIKAIGEFTIANRQRRRETRHKQAAAARDTLKDIFTSDKARAAMQMIDWSGRSYQDGETVHEITYDQIPGALRVTNFTFSAPEKFIRDCFEDLLDKLELMQHYVNIEFLHFNDLAVPLSYYAKIIAHQMPHFEPFLDTYGYEGAKKFILHAANTQES